MVHGLRMLGQPLVFFQGCLPVPKPSLYESLVGAASKVELSSGEAETGISLYRILQPVPSLIPSELKGTFLVFHEPHGVMVFPGLGGLLVTKITRSCVGAH